MLLVPAQPELSPMAAPWLQGTGEIGQLHREHSHTAGKEESVPRKEGTWIGKRHNEVSATGSGTETAEGRFGSSYQSKKISQSLG